MLALAFAEKTLSGLVFSALVVGIATYFGQPFIFDPIILVSYIAIAIAFRRNIDLLSISLIFIAVRILGELMWRFMDFSVWFKIPCYLILFIVALWLSSGLLRAYLLGLFAVGISLEIYWNWIGYNSPKVMWFFYLLTITVVIRKFLRMRTFLLIELNPKLSPRPLRLDSQLLIANTGFLILDSLMIIEYWVRHLTGNSEIIYVFNSFEYIGQSLGLFMLYMIIVQSIQHLRETELSA